METKFPEVSSWKQTKVLILIILVTKVSMLYRVKLCSLLCKLIKKIMIGNAMPLKWVVGYQPAISNTLYEHSLYRLEVVIGMLAFGIIVRVNLNPKITRIPNVKV